MEPALVLALSEINCKKKKKKTTVETKNLFSQDTRSEIYAECAKTRVNISILRYLLRNNHAYFGRVIV